jgi:formylglycine-generating enzyme required for sulfatase activity
MRRPLASTFSLAAFALPLMLSTPAAAEALRDTLADGQPCPFCPELVSIPAGEFIMGSPPSEAERQGNEAQVKVTIRKPFLVGRFAVTFDEWDACVADGGCGGHHPRDRGGRGQRPVVNVSWEDAVAYTAWLSEKTGRAYRLPSDAEREFVTRAGTSTPFWWGDTISSAQANYNGTFTYGPGEKSEYRRRTLPVASFEPNPWGLYQVHGNVFEWTADCWSEPVDSGARDESARTDGDCGRRVVRGGSFYNIPSWLRSARRHWFGASIRNGTIGFRVARDQER